MSVDPRKWWDGVWHLCKTRLPDVAWRLHSAEPHSLGPERVNKYLKTVDSPARSCMAADRVIKATFVYANLRFLNSAAAELDEKLMEFLANDANHDMSLSEATNIEQNNAVLQLEGQVDMRDRNLRSLDEL